MNNALSKVIGIFGYPIQHSKSPSMHNYVFRKMELPFTYVPFEVSPEKLQIAVEGFRSLNFHGANVTIPYKSKIMPFLDEVCEISNLTESVNTLFWKDSKLCGTTTDGYGALKNLLSQGVNPSGKTIAILGNGGSARAISFQLAKDYPDCKIIIVSRKRERGYMLMDMLNAYRDHIASVCSFENFASIQNQTHIIINTTPLGMYPDIANAPLLESDILPDHIVYDIIYSPLETKLLQMAAQKGCKVVYGLGMLIYQGMKSFEYWTDLKADPKDYFDALNVPLPTFGVE
jgi:shikimate dehydrogenase